MAVTVALDGLKNQMESYATIQNSFSLEYEIRYAVMQKFQVSFMHRKDKLGIDHVDWFIGGLGKSILLFSQLDIALRVNPHIGKFAAMV